MSGFDLGSLARSEDVELSEWGKNKLCEVCAGLEKLGFQAGSAEAFEYFQQTLNKLEAPSEERDARESKLLCGALYFLYADQYLDDSAFEDAHEYIALALNAGWRTRHAFDVAGWLYYVDERPAVARDYFDRALNRDPDQVSSLKGRALALVELDAFEHARSDLTHAINLDADDAELYALRSDIFVRLQQLEKAERDIRQARELGEDPEHALQYARLLLVQGRNEKAERVIEMAAQAGDPSLEALLVRSHMHLGAGRFAMARADAIRASNLFSDDAFAFVQLAHIQLAARKASLALKAAERAVQLDPSLSDAYLVRGAARHLSGQHTASRQDFDRAQQAPAEMPLFLFGPCYALLGNPGFERVLEQVSGQYTRVSIPPEAEPKKKQSRPGRQASGKPARPKSSTRQNPEPSAAPTPNTGGPGGAKMPPGMDNFDPKTLLGQVFDDSGKMKKRFKPFLKMAMKNAPSILKKMPPGILPNVEGFDASALEDIDFSKMSSDQIEEQMREFYEKMQSGEDPFDDDSSGGKPPANGE